MDTQSAISLASTHLKGLGGHVFDLLEITKPVSIEAAVNLSKVVSKLSPILGNLIEFNTVEFLNDFETFKPLGKWLRQDPGFPDAIFQGEIDPPPGFEIKAWFPLATEITARFKDSQNHFPNDETYVAMLAWLPENLIFGKPYIVEVCVVSGLSVAQSRDNHYHNPPDYLVLEPEDTSERTRNLQQTNTNGYKFQGTANQFADAQRLVQSWGDGSTAYNPSREYQAKLRELLAAFPYRLDTNFAKMDRIVHSEIEAFKEHVLATKVHGRTIREWNRLLFRGSESRVRTELESRFGITDQDTKDILQ
jgi:hypothetical protein